MRTTAELKQMQSLPLRAKISMTKRRIREWYESWTKYVIYDEETGKTRSVTLSEEPILSPSEDIDECYRGQVYVSFSGGKDSTVLLHLCREMYSDIEAVFVDTGLEYPEIREFVKTFDNVTILRPKMSFFNVIKTYGYPLISKQVANKVSGAVKNPDSLRMKQLQGIAKNNNGEKSRFCCEKWLPLTECDFLISDKCCDIMKKSPAIKYVKETGKKPILAQMAEESYKRELGWRKTGCNAFNTKIQQSNPMAFWTEQDVLQYIKENNLRIASVYGEVVYAEEPDQLRIEDLGIESDCMDRLTTTGCKRTGCMFCPFGCHLEKSPNRYERMKETHPKQYQYCIGGGEYNEKGMWQPNKQGLGLGKVFDELNAIYGDNFIKY